MSTFPSNTTCENAKLKVGCDSSSRITITIIINTLLASASILWHYFLHYTPDAPFYNVTTPVIWGIGAAIVDIGSFFCFLGSKKIAMIGLIIQSSLVIIGAMMMTKYVFLVPATQNDVYSLSLLLLVDVLNYLMALGSLGKKVVHIA